MSRAVRHRRCALSLNALCVVLAVGACAERSLEIPRPKNEKQETAYYPQSIEKDVDLLFVIDNSGSMRPHQTNLLANFDRLIEALRTDKLGGAIPNVRIGVVSTDVGVGTATLGQFGCTDIGDDGRLQAVARQAGCKVPRDGWISYVDGETNVEGCKGDAIDCVKQAFRCIAELGVEGCGFEAPLEAARRALDPEQNRNPGFRRPDALLAVVFITDEDDCSAAGSGLFQPSDALGPVKSYRCFQHGFDCDQKNPEALGPRQGCKAKTGYLHDVSAYKRFFEQLGVSKDRLILAAISGPDGPVKVLADTDGDPHLEPSCTIDKVDPATGRLAGGAPALRVNALVESLGGQTTAICATDFGPALQRLGEKIVASLGGQCIRSPLLLENGGVACHAGAKGCKMPSCAAGESCDAASGLCLGADGKAGGNRCGATCLDAADCLVSETIGIGGASEVPVQRCPRALFVDPMLPKDACGDHCPCWRIVPRGAACTKLGESPFGLEVMRRGDAPKGSVAVARCRTAVYPWSSPQVQGAALHCSAPGAEKGR